MHEWQTERESEGRERDVHRGLWWGDLKEGVNLGDHGVDESIILKKTLKYYYGNAWTGLMLLRIPVNGQLL